jgi:hypothetical protein
MFGIARLNTLAKFTAASSPTSISFVASTTSSGSSTIILSASAAVGDVAILFDKSETLTDTIPSGWTSNTSLRTLGSTIRQNISWIFVTSGMPGSTITGMTTGGAGRKIMLVFRPNTTATTITVGGISAQTSSTAPTTQTLTGGTAPMIYLAAYGADQSVNSTTWTGGTSTSVLSGSSFVSRYLVYNSTPTNASISMPDSGINIMQSFYMMLT